MADKSRLTLDIDPALHRRLKIEAARNGTTIREICVSAIRRHLAQERETQAPEGQIKEKRAEYLTAAEAPLLAELWDNEEDAVYDDL